MLSQQSWQTIRSIPVHSICSDMARQAQELEAIQADCRAAAEGIGLRMAALRDYVSSLASDMKVGAWVSLGLSGAGGVSMPHLHDVGTKQRLLLDSGRPPGKPGPQPAERAVMAGIPDRDWYEQVVGGASEAFPLPGALLQGWDGES
jgi:hypothetical protein